MVTITEEEARLKWIDLYSDVISNVFSVVNTFRKLIGLVTIYCVIALYFGHVNEYIYVVYTSVFVILFGFIVNVVISFRFMHVFFIDKEYLKEIFLRLTESERAGMLLYRADVGDERIMNFIYVQLAIIHAQRDGKA